MSFTTTVFTWSPNDMSTDASEVQGEQTDGTDLKAELNVFIDHMKDSYDLEPETSTSIYELYPDKTDVSDIIKDLGEAWDDLLVDGHLPEDFDALISANNEARDFAVKLAESEGDPLEPLYDQFKKQDFAYFMQSRYGIDTETAFQVYELFDKDAGPMDMLSSLDEVWEDKVDENGKLPTDFDVLGEAKKEAAIFNEKFAKFKENRAKGHDMSDRLDDTPANLDEVRKAWAQITQSGKITVDELSNSPELFRYIHNELNFDTSFPAHQTPRLTAYKFLESLALDYVGDAKLFQDNELTLTPEQLDQINASIMDIDGYENRETLTLDVNGLLPDLNQSGAQWVVVDMGDGQKLKFTGEGAGQNYQTFVELYNNSPECRQNLAKILDSSPNGDFSFYTVPYMDEGTLAWSAINHDYVALQQDAGHGVLAHEMIHNLSTYNQDILGHGRSMDILINNMINELTKAKTELRGGGSYPALMGLFSKGLDFALEKLGDTPEIRKAYDQFQVVSQAICDNDLAKAREAFASIDLDYEVKILSNDAEDRHDEWVGFDEMKLGDLVSEELVSLLDVDSRYGQEGGLTDTSSAFRMTAFTQSLDPKIKPFMEHAYDTMKVAPVSLSSGMDSEQLWGEHGDVMNRFIERFPEWKGKNNTLKFSKIEDIAQNKDGKWSQEDQETAKFFVDHPEVWHAMDLAKDGDRTKEGDNEVSTRDMLHFIDDSNIFGKKFIDENRKMLDFIKLRWDVWNGKGTTVSFDKLQQIADQKGKNSFGEPWTDAESKAAKFILENKTFAYFMDIYGSQRSSDQTMGNDFLHWYDERVAN